MSLVRAASAIRQSLSQHLRLASSALETSQQAGSWLARYYAAGYLDKNQVTDRVITAVKNFSKVDPNKVTPSAKFSDLGLDSLDTVELVMAMEEEFTIEMPDDDADKILSVDDAVEYFANHPHAK
eukprot:TRINITY_DN1937_c0_g1_i2.p2 TRINITY_DN1937_c0_g1~~TRINITY_DN1937_c0_g1_i2.p2  ORF type:complete len:125 (-),score=14.19 TRINITY_DN1937_c0_g1_i2:204-578(-)